ncbi:Protein bicaudal D 2 [Nymphon striatum]|nr:Protein bicaudal D 2 [Nymphon striatum]
MSEGLETVEELRHEIERLNRELAQTSHDKIQSAQYGLVLLDEKETLQQKYEEVELQYESTKNELELVREEEILPYIKLIAWLRVMMCKPEEEIQKERPKTHAACSEALAKFQNTHKVTTTTGVEQEESLIYESATREASLNLSLSDLERELKQVKLELERCQAEKERIVSENIELTKSYELSDWEKKNLKSELRELKFRETRLLSDYSELEEENIGLQKQVSALRSSQVEFESSKIEIRRLQEEVDILNSQVEELSNLKELARNQMEEALGALQSEREQKYALRKELDQRLNSESTSMFNLSNLALSGFKFGQSKRPSSSNSKNNNNSNPSNDEQITYSNISKNNNFKSINDEQVIYSISNISKNNNEQIKYSNISKPPNDDYNNKSLCCDCGVVSLLKFGNASDIKYYTSRMLSFTDAGHEDGRTENENSENVLANKLDNQLANSNNATGDKYPESSHQSNVSDLLSELHITEIRRLEKQVEQSEDEKDSLSTTVNQLKKSLDKTENELSQQRSWVSQLDSNLTTLRKLHEKSTENDMDTEDNIGDSDKITVDLIGQLQADLQHLQDKDTIPGKPYYDIVLDLERHQRKLQLKVGEYELKMNDMESDMKTISEIACETQGSLTTTQDSLTSASEELAKLYHHICMVNGETPNRVMLDHMKSPKQRKSTTSADSVEQSPQTKRRSDQQLKLHSWYLKMKSELGNTLAQTVFQSGESDTKGDPIMCNKLLETVNDQIKFLGQAIEHSIEMNRQKIIVNSVSSISQNGETTTPAETEELQEQVIKLKSLLSTKREQIATLRTVLKANKQTAEVALANLKLKYENEKSIVSETMTKLRNELKALKEDAATFASLRAMFAARCEEYVTQLDDLQHQVTSSDEEKKTLNTLLRMAIQQKLMLTQRLEDLEIHRERTDMRRQGGRGRMNIPRVSGGGHINSYSLNSSPLHQRRDH